MAGPVVAVVLAVLGMARAAGAAPAGLGDVTAVKIGSGVATLSIGEDVEVVRVCAPTIVRVDYRRGGQGDPDTPMIDPASASMLDATATISNKGDAIDIRTRRMHLVIHKSPCRLSLLDDQGKALLAEQPAAGVFVDSAAQDGGVLMNHPAGQNFYGVHAYGLAEMKNPAAHTLLRNGDAVAGRGYEANASYQGGAGGPLIWTTSGYGLLVDSDNGFFVVDPGRLEFRYGHPDTNNNGRRYSKKNSVSYFLFVGEPKELIGAAVRVTGPAPMFPKWAVGFTNSQWGMTEPELLDVLDTYRAKDIPIDNFTLDFDWKAWGDDDFGEFRWNKDNFPSALLPPHSAESLRSKLEALHVKLTGIMKPRIVRCAIPGKEQPLTIQAAQADEMNLWYAGAQDHLDYLRPQHFVGELDFGKPECRSWYWKQISTHGAIEEGICGFWNDEADEAGAANGHFMFDDFQFAQMQQSLYDGWRAQSEPSRMWSLNRNFYLGAQRYAYGLWSGDIGTGFATMATQAGRMLAAVSVGEARWGMDTGGFTGHPTPENYARWIQFAAFVPVFRVHNVIGEHRQPWVYGPEAEEIARDAIRRRYALAPYVYACEHEASEQGVGVVRPLMMEFPSDPGSANVSDEWMFGDALLVAPVLTQGAQSRKVYLPPGKWVDYFRGDVHAGPATLDYPINAGSWANVPLFVRSGSVVVTTAVVPAINAAAPKQIELDAFADSTAVPQMIYDDDGTRYAYEQGAWCKQTLTVKQEGGTARLVVGAKTGSYASTVKTILARVHGQAAMGVTLNGTALNKAESLEALMGMDSGWTVGHDVYGPVTIVRLPAGSRQEQVILIDGSAAVPGGGERVAAADFSISAPTLAARAKIDTSHASAGARGYVDGLADAGASVTFDLKRHEWGDYAAVVRAGNSAAAERSVAVFVNGKRQGVLTVPPHVGQADWARVPLTLTLGAGNNIISLRAEGAVPELALSSIDVPWEVGVSTKP